MQQPFQIQPLNFLAEPARDGAAALYWQAFSGKLARLFGPADRAVPMIRAGLDASHALAATDPAGSLIGVAGFRSPEGSFVSLSPALLRAHYGQTGGAWRMAALRLLSQDTDNTRFLIDGLCVAEAHRSQGVGRALLQALAEQARRRGYPAMRLDVASSNTRARALYEREGFVVVQRQSLPLAFPIFRVSACLVMERPLPQPI